MHHWINASVSHVFTQNKTEAEPLFSKTGLLILALTGLLILTPQFKTALKFAWWCFLAPIGHKEDQRSRLDAFYERQASIYDKTRSRLLRGRATMLSLCATHLAARGKTTKKPIWVDIGGGTGWNIEKMNEYMPLSEFEHIYLVDLCAPLLEVAEKRFRERGWTNITCLLQDATHFTLPDWEKHGVPSTGPLDFVTMSYSLSMIPDFYSVVDRVSQFLSPTGLLGICDFYVAGKGRQADKVGDMATRSMNWLSRIFWLHWFEFDHVDLHPSRRLYLEHKFGTVKTFNGRNHFLVPYLIQIPYYVALMTSRHGVARKALQAYDVDVNIKTAASTQRLVPLLEQNSDSETSPPQVHADGTIEAPESLLLPPAAYDNDDNTQTLESSREAAATFAIDAYLNAVAQRQKPPSNQLNIGPDSALTTFHYAQKLFVRVPYVDLPIHKELFRTWIYGFTWEDPRTDLDYIPMTKDDSVMCITSAGDNALHYAIEKNPGRIHTVDMNPCQGHLLELKIASIVALDFEDFWSMFGLGKHPDFIKLLDTKLSPYLTSHAYQFWRNNASAFKKNFYLRGYSGWSLRLMKYVNRISRMQKNVDAFCDADDIETQREIWDTKLRRVVLGKWLVKLAMKNPIFLWNALGVPRNQARLFTCETSTLQYAADTFDPIARNSHLKTDNYFYQVSLNQKYTEECRPLYLTPEGFEKLKRDASRIDSFRIHTDSITATLERLGPESLTIFIGMDHMDWYPNSLEDDTSPDDCELTQSVRLIRTALKPKGRAYWRSAGMNPWYSAVFEREGFAVRRLQVRVPHSQIPIDRVNMYASFWEAVKK